MSIKTVNIFIASAGALAEERTQLRLHLSNENDAWIKKGVYLQAQVWEKESLSFTPGRKQSDFNDVLLKSDIMICLVFDKVGPFTYEEIYQGYTSLIDGGNPKKLYVFFKNAPIDSSNISDDFLKVNQLKKEIQRLEQVYASYNNLDSLWVQVKAILDRDVPELTKLSIQEALVELLNEIHPDIHKHFKGGANQLNVMLTPTHSQALRQLLSQAEGTPLLSLSPTYSVIMGGAGNTNGSDVYDLVGGYTEGYALTKMAGYPML